MLCEAAGVSAIVAVSDEFRHQRSSYFGPHEKEFSTNYNEIWADRGGIRTSPMFYSLDVVSPRKNLSSIPSKKRAMYRKRFEMLDSIRQKILRTYGRRVDEVAADSVEQGDQIDDVLAPQRSADQQHP
jgi:uncharacterized protein VirK/YbjX